ncbi:MAG: fluoride efflux transporter CrcB [Hydrogenophaga sp.]|uniref:fluoride efflux transporter CrcB n=1 Tax=Hydrogenophaga sp. TaxID=1904254 RepID=UPI00274B9CAA|nr:fluoride efflux transporter CrcB [Hydrogenophaga sp.]MDP2416934.1 fluoride efflux transporter CrcB [Hydrogenophaga sp.]MDZ4187640.1 fluoride efflux transporter CrcB [Hydrogenophaga sp.]
MPSVIAICLGACLGALARWRLSLWLNEGSALLPWGTLTANWVGAYLVGFAVVVFQSQTQLDPAWRLAIITGLLGALTTFSTFSVEVVSMLQHGRWLLAVGTSSLHLLGSLLLTAVGMKMAGWWWAPA